LTLYNESAEGGESNARAARCHQYKLNAPTNFCEVLCVTNTRQRFSPDIFATNHRKHTTHVEVTKALAALQPLYTKDNIEIVTADGTRVRGIVRSMKMTQALTKPSVKMERADGDIVKISFTDIVEIIDHNQSTDAADATDAAAG